MNAKDTVLSDKDIDKIEQRITKGEIKGMNETLNALVETQAEITWPVAFKAGFVEGQADKGHVEAILRVANESLKEGRREVVEFIEHYAANTQGKGGI